MRFAFVLLSLACAAAQNPKDTFTATATQDKTPRVGIVLSTFSGSEDHDGTAIPGLAEPRPRGSQLTAAQYGMLVRKALEIGQPRTGGLETIVQPDDWVLIHVGFALGRIDEAEARATLELLGEAELAS